MYGLEKWTGRYPKNTARDPETSGRECDKVRTNDSDWEGSGVRRLRQLPTKTNKEGWSL